MKIRNQKWFSFSLNSVSVDTTETKKLQAEKCYWPGEVGFD